MPDIPILWSQDSEIRTFVSMHLKNYSIYVFSNLNAVLFICIPLRYKVKTKWILFCIFLIPILFISLIFILKRLYSKDQINKPTMHPFNKVLLLIIGSFFLFNSILVYGYGSPPDFTDRHQSESSCSKFKFSTSLYYKTRTIRSIGLDQYIGLFKEPAQRIDIRDLIHSKNAYPFSPFDQDFKLNTATAYWMGLRIKKWNRPRTRELGLAPRYYQWDRSVFSKWTRQFVNE